MYSMEKIYIKAYLSTHVFNAQFSHNFLVQLQQQKAALEREASSASTSKAKAQCRAKRLCENAEKKKKLMEEISKLQKDIYVDLEERDKELCGLPENIKKRKRHKPEPEEDDEEESSQEDGGTDGMGSDADSQVRDHQEQPPRKIPKKISDFSDKFRSHGNEHIKYVKGWNFPSKSSGVSLVMPNAYKEKIYHNEFFSYRELFKVINRKETTTASARVETLVNAICSVDDQHSSEQQGSMGITVCDLAILQGEFFFIYTQMYPQHSLSHREHELTIYDYIKKGFGIARALDYDDKARKYYISLIGEAWIVQNLAMNHQLSTITQMPVQTNNSQNKRSNNFKQQNGNSGSFRGRGRGKAFGGGGRGGFTRKPNCQSDKPCYAFNGMSKNLATCPNGTGCNYKHVCYECKGNHPANECDCKK